MDEKQILIIGIVSIIFIIFMIIIHTLDDHSLSSIKARKVGDGQHGTARWATPKIQQIAKALHLSKSTVFRAIKELETAGLLTRENRCQGGQKSNLYRIGDDKNV